VRLLLQLHQLLLLRTLHHQLLAVYRKSSATHPHLTSCNDVVQLPRPRLLAGAAPGNPQCLAPIRPHHIAIDVHPVRTDAKVWRCCSLNQEQGFCVKCGCDRVELVTPACQQAVVLPQF
jgi:hypothetical protein